MGWKYVASHKDWYHIYLAQSGTAEELHTDPFVKSMLFQKYQKSLWSIALSDMIILGVLIMGILPSVQHRGIRTGFIPGKPSVSAECGGRDAASYHAASNGCRHL